MTIGATGQGIRQIVVRLSMLPLAIGLAIGVAESVAVNRVLEAQLVGVSTFDPVSLAAVSVVLMLATLLGCLVP